MSAKALKEHGLSQRHLIRPSSGDTPEPPAPGGWQRPADWLALPDVEGQDKFVGLYAIHEHSNYCALVAENAFTVDWGDGTVQDYAIGQKAEHEYDYATYDVAGSTLCSRGYKQAIITVTAQTGFSLSKIDLQQLHTVALANPGFYFISKFLDIAIRGNVLSTLIVSTASPRVYFPLLEQFSLLENTLSSHAGLLKECLGLKKVSNFYTYSSLNLASAFAYCSSLVDVCDIDARVATNISSLFYSASSLMDGPVISAPEAQYLDDLYCGCTALKKTGDIYSPKAYSATRIFFNCKALESPGMISLNTASFTGSMFYGCASLVVGPAYNIENTVNAASFYSGCFALSKINTLVSLEDGFDIANCNLSASALNAFYSILPTVVSKTLNVSGNPGTASDNPSIATAKGWTVSG